ncbi:hypothetical protein C161_19321, partial [Paenibacillus sp. FSL R5-192]|uniref:hypothetical protein n=1 Tax=Paenibacillus sp. FSL R5-192 TaxID=1226754 RepID=UPI0003E276F3
DTVIRASVVEGTKSNLKKRSVRLCLQIFPFKKGNQKNLETTAIGRSIRTRNVIYAPHQTYLFN